MDISEQEINNEILIDAVASRPLLYNRYEKEGSNLLLKANLWREVAKAVFFEQWMGLNERQKKYADFLCQKRFKNLRACLCRELRSQRNRAPKKRRTYLYYEQMKFLLPYMEVKEQSTRVRDENYTTIEDTQDDFKSDDYEIKVKQEDTFSPPNSPIPNFSKPAHTDDPVANATNASDPETLFMLSLVPMLKSLPQSKKLDAQIEMLTLFKRFLSEQPD